MSLKEWVLFVAVGVALFIGVLGLGKSETVTERVIQEFKGLAGPDIDSSYLSVNGVRHWFYTPPIYSATTTPVTIKTPAATTTLMTGSGCHFSTASTSAKAIRFAKSITTPTATTTFLFGANSGANATPSVTATTTTNDFVFGPNQYLVMSMVGGTGVDSPVGRCAFEFMAVTN